MFVHNILRKKGSYVATVGPHAPLIDAIECMNFENVAVLIASRDGLTALGVVSEHTIVRALRDYGRDVFALEVADVMSTPVISCRPTDTTAFVMSLMWCHGVHHVAVLERATLAGIVSYDDILGCRYGLAPDDGVTADSPRELRPGSGRPSVLRH